MEAIQFKLIRPSPTLKRDIECFRMSTHNVEGDVAVQVCPNTFPGLVFQQHNHQTAIQDIVVASGRVVRVPTLFVHGQVTDRSVMHFTAPYTTIQVIFKPHALRTIFGIDASMLTNSSIGPTHSAAKHLNFHDQSHFIRDIKAFSGINPKDITQNIHDFYRDQVGSSYIYR